MLRTTPARRQHACPRIARLPPTPAREGTQPCQHSRQPNVSDSRSTLQTTRAPCLWHNAPERRLVSRSRTQGVLQRSRSRGAGAPSALGRVLPGTRGPRCGRARRESSTDACHHAPRSRDGARSLPSLAPGLSSRPAERRAPCPAPSPEPHAREAIRRDTALARRIRG